MVFSVPLAHLTVKLSHYAYRDPDRARADMAELGLTDFHFFSHPPNEVMCAAGDDKLYLAFRGTEAKVVDWVQNAEFKPVPGELGGAVHSGFHSGLSDLWDEVAGIVEASGKPVVATGHSLGGALATLAAARLRDTGIEVAAVYTYGQPRVGLRNFRAAYDRILADRTYRIINHIDLVTRVPLMLQGYRHIGNRVYFDGAGEGWVGASAWKIAVEDVKFRLAHLGSIKAAGLSPHEMSAYVDLVESL